MIEMNDTQWPRFEVFVQETLGSPYLDYGSIHAPDAELALLNARDVFARRPECISMWVVPTNAINSMTLEEISTGTVPDSTGEGSPLESYAIFCKSRNAGTQTYAGQLKARSPQEALHLARDQAPPGKTVFAWWVFPARMILSSTAEDIPSLFAPASGKAFRMAAEFQTVSAMRKIRHSPGEV